MESYIVRVYRRDEMTETSVPLRGIVERVGTVGQEAFGTKEELWNILSVEHITGSKKKNPTSRLHTLNKKQVNTE